MLLADSYLHQKNLTKATEALVQFLDNTLESEAWSPAFDLLASCLEETEKGLPPPDATLRWISEGNTVQKESLTTLPSTSIFLYFLDPDGNTLYPPLDERYAQALVELSTGTPAPASASHHHSSDLMAAAD